MPITENAPIQRYESGTVESVDDTLVAESHVTIDLDGIELIRTTCSPGQMREWVIGYLFSEGRIASPEDVAEIRENRYYWGFVEETPAPGGVEMLFLTPNYDYLARWLVGLCDRATVVSPTELQARMRAFAERLHRHYLGR